MAEIDPGDIIAAIKKMTRSQKKDFVSELKKSGIKLGEKASGSASTESAFKSVGDVTRNFTKSLIDAVKNTEDVLTVTDAFSQSIRRLRIENEEFVKSGYSDKMFDFSKNIELANDRSLKLTGNFKAARRSVDALRENFQAFGFVTDSVRQNLIDNSIALEAAGYNVDDFAKIVDSATMSFNQTSGEINDLTAVLIKAGREFSIAPKELTKNFQFAQKNFAYSAKGIMDNFIKLQKMSRTTGVEFSKLTTTFGDQMDTFQGSATMAGKLNQILGESLFNSIDLLQMEEGQRAEFIQKTLTDRVGGRLDSLGKYNLKAIANQLKLSPEETRRFLRGEAPKSAEDMEKLRKKTPQEIATARLGTEMQNLERSIKRYQTPYERGLINLNAETLKHTKQLIGVNGKLKEQVDLYGSLIMGQQTVAGKTSAGAEGLTGADAMTAKIAMEMIPSTFKALETLAKKLPGGGAIIDKATKLVGADNKDAIIRLAGAAIASRLAQDLQDTPQAKKKQANLFGTADTDQKTGATTPKQQTAAGSTTRQPPKTPPPPTEEKKKKTQTNISQGAFEGSTFIFKLGDNFFTSMKKALEFDFDQESRDQ